MGDSAPVLNLVSIDYLRLATWDWQYYLELSAQLRRKWVGWRAGRWLQYKMEVSGDGKIKYGCATQSDKGHGIFEATGSDAHIFWHWLVNTQTVEDLCRLYATRIDLQSTKVAHPKQDYVKMHSRLRKPKQLILGDEGNTLYVGNRESDSFWRLYDKTAKHTRLEVELKGKQAKGAWLFLTHQPGELAELYSHYIQKSRIPALIASYYQDCVVPASADDLKTEPVIDLEKKLNWLVRLDALVYKLARDHTTGARMAEILTRWYEYRQIVDGTGQNIDTLQGDVIESDR